MTTKGTKQDKKFKYPGIRAVLDGNSSVIMCEREASDAAGAFPITPSTQMGEYWATEAAKGHLNVSNKPLIFVEPEGEHAAAAVTAGMAMSGLRSANFSSGQGIAYMHESLYAAVGKRLTYVLNMGSRAMTKSTLNVHAGHDDYHAIDDTGFFQMFGKDPQSAADLCLIAHRIAELSLTPGTVAQDGFLTTHLMESMMCPERALVAEYLGRPDDVIECPTPAQKLMFGETRRRVPALWDVDNPVMAGVVQNQDSYMQSVASQRPYFFDHIPALADQAMEEYYQLTGRRYGRIRTYKTDDADYLLVGQGSVVGSCEVVADYLREKRKLKVGVVDLVMWRPFPGRLVAEIFKGRKGVSVLERIDQPLAEDLPIAREARAALAKCLENGRAGKAVHEGYPVFKKLDDAPPVYSMSFGMGSRDLQPEGIIGAVENMLPDGKQKKMGYLSIDFIRPKAITPDQENYQKALEKGYPKVRELSIHGSENPNLMPKGSVTIRMHSIGGWGMITTGKNLAMTLFDLLGMDVKANPKYGSEKKGQPTTFFMSAADEPIRLNAEYNFVDVVMSPDPKVFGHSNPLAGLKKGGLFILQSELTTPEEVWASVPPRFQKIIEDNQIRFYSMDALKIAQEEARDPELQYRMQGIAFQGSFFATAPIVREKGLDEKTLFEAIEKQLQNKFGKKGKRVVEDNLRVVRRGFDEIKEIKYKELIAKKPIVVPKAEAAKTPMIPLMAREIPKSKAPVTDIRRFWEQTGNFYFTGHANDNLADPFIAMSCIPAVTGTFRDMSSIRYEYPVWQSDKCTGCGSCWTVCPDSAIPGLVQDVSEILETVVGRLERAGKPTKYLRKSLRPLEKNMRERMVAAEDSASVAKIMSEAIQDVIEGSMVEGDALKELKAEFDSFKAEIGDFQFAMTQPFFRTREGDKPGTGGLLSVTVNPYACKGCMECVKECPADCLKPAPETTESVAKLRKKWDFWMSLPTTKKDYMRLDELEEGLGAPETMLLDKEVYRYMCGGDGACVGCGEKTALHLFTSTVNMLMRSRVPKHVARIADLIQRLEARVRDRLAAGSSEPVEKLLEKAKKSPPAGADAAWAERHLRTLEGLKKLHWQYVEGKTGKGRSNMGMINNTGCTTVWASTWPLNPYPFPWANHLFQDAASISMGVFEGHMRKMADGFRHIRVAELLLENAYEPKTHDDLFTYFNWEHFTDEEWLLCPPVVALGGDGSMYDIGFQNLSRLLISGKPVKVVVADTQVYSNTGGQACTSGFIGQVSDMADFGKVWKGKPEARKEIALVGIAHRVPYVMQGSIARVSHLIAGFIRGLNIKRPAVFNIYTACPPEHGIGDAAAALQARLALESRAYPVFRYDPEKGKTLAECCDIEGNPSEEDVFSTTTLRYKDEDGKEATMEVPVTFADFAVTEARFRKHFRLAPRGTWNDDMVPVHEFLGMDAKERKGKFPYVWIVDQKTNTLQRVMVSQTIIQSAEERRDFWIMLRALAAEPAEPAGETPDEAALAAKARQEVVERLTAGFLQASGLR